MRSRVPRWAPLTLTIIGSAGLFILTVVPRGHGATKWILITVSVLLVIAGPIGTELASRLSAEDSRLKVDVQLDPPLVGIPSFSKWDAQIETWLSSVRENCLASLPSQTEQRQASKKDSTSWVFGAGGMGTGPSVRELMQYEERKSAGETLPPEQEEALRETNERISRATLMAVQAFTSADDRTEEEYRDEIDRYVDSWRKILHRRVESEYMARQLGMFRVTLINDTEKTFEGVQLEVNFPGQVKVISDDGKDKEVDIPDRPRPFGERRLAFPMPNVGIYPPIGFHHMSVEPPSRPKIESGDRVSITYMPVTLRPGGGRVVLETLHLFSGDPAGTTITANWEATAKNADGRVRGVVELEVGSQMDISDIVEWAVATQRS